MSKKLAKPNEKRIQKVAENVHGRIVNVFEKYSKKYCNGIGKSNFAPPPQDDHEFKVAINKLLKTSGNEELASAAIAGIKVFGRNINGHKGMEAQVLLRKGEKKFILSTFKADREEYFKWNIISYADFMNKEVFHEEITGTSEQIDKTNKAKSLVCRYIAIGEWREIEALLTHKNGNVAWYAAEGLIHHYSSEGRFDEIERIMRHTDALVQRNISWALKKVAEKYSVTPSINKVFVNALEHCNRWVRSDAAEMLTYHNINKGKTDLVNGMLKIDCDFVKMSVVEALVRTLNDNKDPDVINNAFSALQNSLNDKDEMVRLTIAFSLGEAARKGLNIVRLAPALRKALAEEESPMVKQQMQDTLLLCEKNK